MAEASLESTTTSVSVNFEPGIHPFLKSQEDAVEQNFLKGDLNAHFWNPEVAQRIKRNSYFKPLFLAIDSVAPVPEALRSSKDYLQYQEDAWDWAFLPARPNELNVKGEVYLIKADIGPNSPFAKYDKYQDPIPGVDLGGQEGEAAVDNMATSLVGQDLLFVGAIMAAMKVAPRLLRRESENPIGDNIARLLQKPFSRRSVLAGTAKLAFATAAISLLRFSPNFFAPLASTEQAAQFWQSANQILNGGLARSSWLDGRTALLMAKSEDAAKLVSPEIRNGADYSVVMGVYHGLDQDVLHNESARKEAIRNLAQETLDMGRKLYSSYFGITAEQVPSEALNGLLDYLAQIDIVRIKDPGGPDIQPDFYAKHMAQLKDCVFPVVLSGKSSQVEEAIKDLRPQ